MKKNSEPIINRGEIYYTNLSPSQGSEQGGLRPTLIVQNNVGNKHSPTTIVVPLTSRLTKKQLPTHIVLAEGCGLSCESVVLCEQVRTIDKSRLSNKLGAVSNEVMAQVDKALKISLGLGD
jgi:mRNA interferase MazF